jgi:hypothetical protein
MGPHLGIQLMQQQQIHPPGKAQIIHGVHQTQEIAVAQPGRFKAEIDVRAWLMASHGPRTEQPNGLKLGLACQYIQQLKRRALGDSGESRWAICFCRGGAIGHCCSSKHRPSNLRRNY